MIFIISSPSGGGKGTIIAHLLQSFPTLEFSVSATSRKPREGEQDGVNYYFVSPEEFKRKIANDELIEYEEVYAGSYYGTPKSEIDRIQRKGHHVVFEVDVKGGIKLKKIFGEKALSIFIMPPSIEELRRRLIGRATEPLDVIEKRVAKAALELSYAEQYDRVLVNDDLNLAKAQADEIIRQYIDRETIG
ncbi:MAG: guanylate kinase [Paludibacteraceae bacterium]|nr:guanylate kinase [Paludibacteraceae bacterium]